jgi:hypothetical protein
VTDDLLRLLEEVVAVHRRRLDRAEHCGRTGQAVVSDDELDLLRLEFLRARVELEQTRLAFGTET